jgi:tetratricopeptide (TPR) repeat protein
MSTAQHLDDLERRSLIALASASPELAYIFRHVLAQDAVYASLVRRQRGAIHELVGDVLETLYSHQPASPLLAAQLGRHFGEAGNGERALPYLVLAGDQALSQYANREAAGYYAQALEIARSLPDAAGIGRLYEARGQALERLGDYPQALAGYEAMETQAGENGDPATALAALIAQTRLRCTFTTVANPVLGRALAERALELARQLGDRAAEARLLLYLLRLSVWAGDTAQAIEFGERAAAAARAQGLQSLLVESLNELAQWGYVNTMQLRLAGERLDEARALLPALADPYRQVDTLANLSIQCTLMGEYEQALQHAAEIKRISQAVQYSWGLVQNLIGTGIVHLERGELGPAVALLEEGIRLGRQYSVGHSAAMTYGFLVRAYGAVGDYETGLAALTRMRQATTQVRSLDIWRLSAETLLLLAAGRVLEAAAAFAQVSQLGPLFDVIAYRLLASAGAQLGLAQGDPAAVLRVVDPVIDGMRREGGRTILCEALAYRGRALLASGRLAEAAPALAEARALAEAIGRRLDLWTVLAAQLELANRQGQAAEAQSLRRELHALLHQLAEAAGSPQRRAGFLGRPDVQAALHL